MLGFSAISETPISALPAAKALWNKVAARATTWTKDAIAAGVWSKVASAVATWSRKY